LGDCPTPLESRVDGLHGGSNGGRVCWAVTGTLCRGEPQGTFARKFRDCMHCAFFVYVTRQEKGGLLTIEEIMSTLHPR